MCQGTTKSGSKCKNPQEPYCRFHTPVTDFDFPLPVVNCTTRVQNKLKTIMKKGPSKKDGKGIIYVYFLISDAKDSYYKIGRTSRSEDERLKEWGKDVKLKGSWDVKYHHIIERIIHVYLDDVRVYRYLVNQKNDEEGEKYCSVWKTDGVPIETKDKLLKEKHKLEGIKKNIEWFKIPWKILEPILIEIVKLDFEKKIKNH